MNGKASLLEAAAACERAAGAVGTQQEVAEIMAVLEHREALQIEATNARLARVATTAMRQEERLPLRDDGHEFARIEARVPKGLFYGLMHQKNFGYEGFVSDDGMKDFSKSYPQFMVKTVSGKTTVTVGTDLNRRKQRKQRVNFGRGTIKFAA